MKKNETWNAATRFLPKPHRALDKTLVKMGFAAVMALALPWEQGFSQTLFGWDVNGVAAGTTTLDATTAASNITGGQLSLTGLTASSASNTFGGTNWNLTDTFDETDKYFSFTVTPTAGYEVTYASLQWDQGVTGTAPNTTRWGYKVGAGAFSLQTPFTSSNSSNAAWDFSDFTATDTVEFRFWTYGATSVGGGASASGGASRIRTLTGDDLILFGSVAAIVPAGASMYWTADGATLGGTGTWNATNTNWSATESPVSGATWNATKSAIFEGTAGTVTVGSVSVDEGLIFGTTGYTLSSGTITLSGAASANNTITTQPSVTATIASSLAGSAGLNKAGDGTLVLSGSNSYTGGTTLSAGTLQLGAGSTSGSISGDIVNDGVLVVNRSDSLSLSSAISGSGSVVKNNTGALVLSGSNSYSGGTTMSAGTLQIGHANVLGSGTLQLGVSGTTATMVITSTDSSDRTISNALGQFAGSSWNTTFGSAGTGNLTFSNTTDVDLGASRTFTISNEWTSFANAFTGGSNRALTKAGDGTLILTANSTYQGATTINAGSLQIGNGGTSGSIALTSGVSNNGALVFNRSDDLSVTSTINGTGILIQNGTGNLTLSASNNYSGGTTINTGTLVISHAYGAGSGTITQASDSSLLKFDTTGTIANAMSVHNVSANKTVTLSGGITVHNAVFDVASGETLTITNTINGSGGVTKNGTGSLVLSGNNTYSASTVINSGTLEAAHAGALGSNNTVDVTGGTLLVTAEGALEGKNITMSTNTIGLQFSGNYSGAMGSLTLSSDSIIDLGSGSVRLLLQGITFSTHTLRFYNWTGTTLSAGGTGADTDRVYFGPDLSDEALAKISFYSGSANDSFLGTGFDLGLRATGFDPAWGYQIIPVPEPETWATGILLLLGGSVWFYRRFRSQLNPFAAEAQPIHEAPKNRRNDPASRNPDTSSFRCS